MFALSLPLFVSLFPRVALFASHSLPFPTVRSSLRLPLACSSALSVLYSGSSSRTCAGIQSRFLEYGPLHPLPVSTSQAMASKTGTSRAVGPCFRTALYGCSRVRRPHRYTILNTHVLILYRTRENKLQSILAPTCYVCCNKLQQTCAAKIALRRQGQAHTHVLFSHPRPATPAWPGRPGPRTA